MQSNPTKRCQHIFSKGTQCGSPALRDRKFCYYHEQCPPHRPETYTKMDDPYSTGVITLPPFEDAHSIQLVLRQVTRLLLQKRIDPKTAGLLLYSLQIASANLKRIADERPEPSQVVVDLETVPDTPLETSNPNGSSQSGLANPLHLGKEVDDNSEDILPPGTIRACVRNARHLN